MKPQDIPIKSAMIAWNPVPPGDGRIQIIKWPDEDYLVNKLKLQNTDGACWTNWDQAKVRDLQFRLLAIGWRIVLTDGLNPKDVHEAFMVIPEYRSLWTDDST